MILLPFAYSFGLVFVGLFFLFCFLSREIPLVFAVKQFGDDKFSESFDLWTNLSLY